MDAIRVYSTEAGRWIEPGELVYVCDEWGYWRDEPPAVYLGKSRSGHIITEDDEGRHSFDWHVVRDVVPA